MFYLFFSFITFPIGYNNIYCYYKYNCYIIISLYHELNAVPLLDYFENYILISTIHLDCKWTETELQDRWKLTGLMEIDPGEDLIKYWQTVTGL